MPDNNKIILNGRAKNIRKHKGCAFVDLDTSSGIIQLCFREHMLDQMPMRGDIISADGVMSKTKTGQDTLFIDSINILNRSQNPDTVNYNMKQLILQRYDAEEQIRGIMHQNDIIAVNTSVLNHFKGTSNILPFETTDIKGKTYFMKYTHELGLKRIMTDTQLPVYEIGKVFRNMGKGQRYYREYTVLETQIPFKSLSYGIELVKHIADSVAKTSGDKSFENVPTYTMEQMFADIGLDFWTLSNEKQRNIYKTKIKKLPGPFFLSNPPSDWSPLTLKGKDGRTALDAELIYKGRGIAHICQERYDISDIRAGMLADKNAVYADQDFLEHMTAGMPPSVGFAFGIDRFLATLRQTEILKDVIPYAR